jgi:cytosine/adenosine deaminase-related metal-dependent hydrolase
LRQSLRAKFLIKNHRCVIPDGFVQIDNRVIGKADKYRGQKAIDTGNAIIMPGLVNTHTHLQLTKLQGQIKKQPSFTKWLDKLVEEISKWDKFQHFESLQIGFEMLRQTGTTLFGEICSSAFLLDFYKSLPLRKVIFYEVIDPNPDTALLTFQKVKRTVAKYKVSDTFVVGFSPHAPYSVSPHLYRHIFSHFNQQLIATHVSESPEEIEFLRRLTGRIARRKIKTGFEFPFSVPPQLTPIQYLDKLYPLHKMVLLIHCNYLDRKDIETISRSQASVVFCPGSHQYFNHKPHPVKELLKAGVNVALGTDSLASNERLDMFREMQIVRKNYHISENLIFKMATENGASALNIKSGVLEAGYFADLICIKTPPELKMHEVFEFLCGGEKEVLLSMVGGRVVYARGSQD